MVEFAASVLLLVLILSGIIDYGRALQERTVLVEASRAGSRAIARFYFESPITMATVAANPDAASLAQLQHWAEGIDMAVHAILAAGLEPSNYNIETYITPRVFAGLGGYSELAIHLNISARPGVRRFLITPSALVTNCVGSNFLLRAPPGQILAYMDLRLFLPESNPSCAPES